MPMSGTSVDLFKILFAAGDYCLSALAVRPAPLHGPNAKHLNSGVPSPIILKLGNVNRMYLYFNNLVAFHGKPWHVLLKAVLTQLPANQGLLGTIRAP